MNENREYLYGQDQSGGQETATAVEEPKEQVKEEAKKTQEEVRKRAEETVESAKQRGKAVLNEQKRNASTELRKYGDALRSAAHTLKEEQGMFAGAIENAAGRLEKASNYIDEHPAEEIVESVNNFAHKHSGVFWGGMLFAGLLASRYFKASEDVGNEEASSAASPQKSPGL